MKITLEEISNTFRSIEGLTIETIIMPEVDDTPYYVASAYGDPDHHVYYVISL